MIHCFVAGVAQSAYRLGDGLNDRRSITGRGNYGIIFLLATTSTPALRLTQLPIERVSGLLVGVKRPGREADDSPPSCAEVRSAWSDTSTPPRRLHIVVLS